VAGVSSYPGLELPLLGNFATANLSRAACKITYVEKLTVALGQNAWEAHVTSIDCLFEAGFADLAGT
jgi:hypothetical protein